MVYTLLHFIYLIYIKNVDFSFFYFPSRKIVFGVTFNKNKII